MKLDAGDDSTFQKINRPAHFVNFQQIIEGLKGLPNLMIQSLLLDGKIANVRGEAYEAWASLLAELNPKEIHIYSIDRPTAYDGVEVVSPNRLQDIAEDLRERFDLTVTAF